LKGSKVRRILIDLFNIRNIYILLLIPCELIKKINGAKPLIFLGLWYVGFKFFDKVIFFNFCKLGFNNKLGGLIFIPPSKSLKTN